VGGEGEGIDVERRHEGERVRRRTTGELGEGVGGIIFSPIITLS